MATADRADCYAPFQSGAVVNFLPRVERLIFTCPIWGLAAALFGIMLCKTGIWAYPSQHLFLQVAQNPFVNPFTHPNDHYLLWNWLGPAIAWCVGATTPLAYFLLHLAMSLGFTGFFVWLAIRILPQRLARVSLVFFFLLPVSGTPYFWVGYDSLTLLLMVAALAAPRSIGLTLASGVALGLQHFEQGIFAAGGLLLANFLTPRPLRTNGLGSMSFAVCLLVGVAIGKLALIALFNVHGVVVNSGRLVWMRSHLDTLLLNFATSWVFVLYAIFGIGWLLAAKYLDRGRAAWPFFAGLLLIFSLLPIVEDTTRVFAITAFPLVCAFWLLDPKFLALFSDRSVALLLCLWVGMPWLWAWGGIPQLGVLPYDVAFASHALVGWPVLGDDLALWPFRAP